MARFEHLAIYKKSFSLLVKIEDLVIKMQKKARYTIGEDLRNITRDFVVSIARINSMEQKDRKIYVEKMFDLINQVYILLGVAKELKLYQTKNQYENLLTDIFDIEKQLEGWKKSF